MQRANPSNLYQLIIIVVLTSSTETKIFGLNKTDVIVRRHLPSAPDCALSENHATSQAAEISIWRYKDDAARQFGYLIQKWEVVTKCHENWVGASDKTIESSMEVGLHDVDLTLASSEQLFKDLKSGTYQVRQPTWDCSYWSDNILTHTIYKVKRTQYRYDPSSKQIVYPPNCELIRPGLYQQGVRWFLTQDDDPHFDMCSLELYKVGHGTILLTKGNIHQVTINQFREMFYLDERLSFTCKTDTFYGTNGGYILSYQMTKTDTSPGPDPAPSVTTPAAPANGSGTDTIIPRSKRVRRGLQEGPYLYLDPRKSPGELKFSCPIENFFSNRQNKSDIYDTSPTATCGQLRASRTKRSLPIVEGGEFLDNYQHSLSRAELQWGLYHLANKTSEDLTMLSKEICLDKQQMHTLAIREYRSQPPSFSSLMAFFPDILAYSVTWAKGSVDIHIAKRVDVELQTPLVCCEYWCKLTEADSWIESHTKLISTPSKASCAWIPRSFLVQDVDTENWVDIISGEVIPPLYTLRVLGKPDLLEYSFNSSDMTDLSDYFPPEELVQPGVNGTQDAKSEQGYLSFGFEWVNKLWTWMTTSIGRAFLSILMIVFIIGMSYLIVKRILSTPIRKRGSYLDATSLLLKS